MVAEVADGVSEMPTFAPPFAVLSYVVDVLESQDWMVPSTPN